MKSNKTCVCVCVCVCECIPVSFASSVLPCQTFGTGAANTRLEHPPLSPTWEGQGKKRETKVSSELVHNLGLEKKLNYGFLPFNSSWRKESN